MPTAHSSRRSPRRRVSGGRPGERISARQVIVSALRFERTDASSSSAFWIRSSVDVANALWDHRTAGSVLSDPARMRYRAGFDGETTHGVFATGRSATDPP